MKSQRAVKARTRKTKARRNPIVTTNQLTEVTRVKAVTPAMTPNQTTAAPVTTLRRAILNKGTSQMRTTLSSPTRIPKSRKSRILTPKAQTTRNLLTEIPRILNLAIIPKATQTPSLIPRTAEVEHQIRIRKIQRRMAEAVVNRTRVIPIQKINTMVVAVTNNRATPIQTLMHRMHGRATTHQETTRATPLLKTEMQASPKATSNSLTMLRELSRCDVWRSY